MALGPSLRQANQLRAMALHNAFATCVRRAQLSFGPADQAGLCVAEDTRPSAPPDGTVEGGKRR